MIISTNSGIFGLAPMNGRPSLFHDLPLLKEAGFEGVDVNYCAAISEGNSRDTIIDGDWKKTMDELREAINKVGFKIPLSHAPFFNVFNLQGRDLTAWNALTHTSIEAAAYLGAPWIVLHPQHVWIEDLKLTKTQVKESLEFLKPFVETARRAGIGIAVENLWCTEVAVLIEIVDTLGEGVGVCLDVGHTNIKNGDKSQSQKDSIEQLGKRIKVLHLHDNIGNNDSHSPPTLGTVNWKEMMSALNSIQFTGAFNLEVTARNLPASLRIDYAKLLVNISKEILKMA